MHINYVSPGIPSITKYWQAVFEIRVHHRFIFSGSLCFCCRFLIFRFSSKWCDCVPIGQIAALHMGKLLRNCFVLCTDLGVTGTTVRWSREFHRRKPVPCSTSHILLLIRVKDVVVTVKRGSKLSQVFSPECPVVVSSGVLFALALVFFS